MRVKNQKKRNPCLFKSIFGAWIERAKKTQTTINTPPRTRTHTHHNETKHHNRNEGKFY